MTWGFYWGGFWGGDEEAPVVAPAPAASAERICGEGLFVSQLEGVNSHVRTLGRIWLDDPDNPGDNLGPPTYQFQLVRNPAGTPGYYALLHGTVSNSVVIKPLNYNEDPHSSPAHSRLVALSAGSSGTALAAIYHSTLGLVTIWNEVIGAGSHAGINFLVGTGPAVSAGPTITGVQLGLSSAIDANSEWVTFVAREREDGNIVVLGVLQRPLVRFGPSDVVGYEMYKFVIDPSIAPGPAAVVETVQAVTSSQPFSPHQLAVGYNLPIDSRPRQRYLWCAGRCDPERFNPTITPLAGSGFAPVGGEGIWVTEDLEGLDNWELVWSAAQGMSHAMRDHVNVGSNAQPKDLGLTFDEAWQRLTLFGIDTDPRQDPVHERAILRFL